MQIILNTAKLVEIYVTCDDFYNEIDNTINRIALEVPLKIQKRRQPQMRESEIMAIVINYHFPGFRRFKWYYQSDNTKSVFFKRPFL